MCSKHPFRAMCCIFYELSWSSVCIKRENIKELFILSVYVRSRRKAASKQRSVTITQVPQNVTYLLGKPGRIRESY